MLKYEELVSTLKRELAGITDMTLAGCLKDFVACGVMPPSLAHLMLGMMLRVSFRPQKIRVISTP